MSTKINKALIKEMQNLDAAGLLRTEAMVTQTENMEVCLSEADCFLDFVGTDLLGWKANKKLKKVAQDALKQYGTGSTALRSSVGTMGIHRQLEQALARFLGVDDAMVLGSAYLAKLGLFETLTNERDTLFLDEMCNPGLYDGARMSSANVVLYRHKDYEHLEYHLKCSQGARYRLVVTDGVFASSGECADLSSILKLTKDYDAIAVVDDSLGLGLLGSNGSGSFGHLLLEDRPGLMAGSFAYALGNVAGGFIAGEQELINWLRLTSRPYLISEPLSPVNAATVLYALESLQQDQSILEKLNAICKYARSQITKKRWKLLRTKHPIVKINVGSTLNAQKMVEHMYQNKILVSGLCYPNTPEGASLLKFNISARHSEAQIDQLVDALEQAFASLEK
ncbi:MAG: pyridoxal phosphate-dependent aminotransferase family protein [Gammaproteobacteria bacterium]|nr:pyridoxal phosphate-dependent aminotransferase family protein [Gammaproteobacteria bacterium]MDH5800009.1 pyridoxal phosphate-dependent aminotransferase family protein [Gammaproteobacteria bacterium]